MDKLGDRQAGGRPRRGTVSRAGKKDAARKTFTVLGATPAGNRLGPCALNCTNWQEIYGFHPGGANVLFTDGSVHFLSANLNIRILACLVTRAGGEVISGGDY